MITGRFKSLDSVNICDVWCYPYINVYADEKVRRQTEEEMKFYEVLSEIIQQPAALLSTRWAAPSLTVHSIESTGPKSQSCFREVKA